MPIKIFKDRSKIRLINYQGCDLKIQLLTAEQDAWVQKQCTDEGKLGLPGRLDSKRYVRTFTARCIQEIPGGIVDGDSNAAVPFVAGKAEAGAPAGMPLGMDPALLAFFDDKAQGQLYDMFNNPGENLGKYLVVEKKD